MSSSFAHIIIHICPSVCPSICPGVQLRLFVIVIKLLVVPSGLFLRRSSGPVPDLSLRLLLHEL